MLIHTVLRHIGDETYVLRSFDHQQHATGFAQLQMKYGDKNHTYSIATWDLSEAVIVPCFDKRLRLLK